MLLPNDTNKDIFIGFTTEEQPSYTYKLDMCEKRIQGITDDADAYTQAVYLILGTERYQYPIYSYNYGVELADLIGQSTDYAISEIKRRVTEALMQDDRTKEIDNWSFETDANTVTVSFTVKSIFGDINIRKEVEI